MPTHPLSVGLALVISSLTPGQGAPAPQQQSPAPITADTTTVVPGDLERIRQRLEEPPQVRIDAGRLQFYVQVEARQRTFADYLRGADLKHGNVKGGAMTHTEFLNFATPRNFRRLR